MKTLLSLAFGVAVCSLLPSNGMAADEDRHPGRRQVLRGTARHLQDGISDENPMNHHEPTMRISA